MGELKGLRGRTWKSIFNFYFNYWLLWFNTWLVHKHLASGKQQNALWLKSQKFKVHVSIHMIDIHGKQRWPLLDTCLSLGLSSLWWSDYLEKGHSKPSPGLHSSPPYSKEPLPCGQLYPVDGKVHWYIVNVCCYGTCLPSSLIPTWAWENKSD